MNFKQVVEEEKEKIAEAAREYARQSYLVSEESHPVADEMKAWDELLGIYDQAMTKAWKSGKKEEQAKNSFVIRKCKEPGGYMCMSYEPVIKPQFGSTPQEALANYLSALKE